MGLDIYLYEAADAAANKRHYAIYDEDAEGNSPSEGMTREQTKAHDEANPYVPHKDVPSVNYPEHLFNRRYLRSSYNGGGFNHAVPDLIGTSTGATYPNACGSLYWIFEPMGRDWDGDEGTLTPDDLPKLRECRARAEQVVAELKTCDRLRVTTVSPNMFSGPQKTTDAEALTVYRTHLASRNGEVSGWYSTNGGNLEVFGDGLTILAAVAGMDTFTPGVHLIYRSDDEGFDSYVQSAEIIVEFCDEAIALIERDGSCQMSWSG